MVGDLLLLLLLLLPHFPGSLQLPKAFDHPIHRPQSVSYHNHKYAANPTLEAFDHPVHTPQHNHPEVTRTHPSHPHLGYPLEEEMQSYWKADGQAELALQVLHRERRGRAKNVIFFLGDGMGISTLTAARILKGQQQQLLGPERALLSFEAFPNVCLARTYCLDSTVADSACSATAYLGGVKTNIGTLGVSGGVKYKKCKGQALPENQVPSILAWAQASGLATGVVTTDQITGASPAAAYSHVASRDWMTDVKVAEDGFDPATCLDIAKQLVRGRTGQNLDVVFGGGRRMFSPTWVSDPETGQPGLRGDIDLIAEWRTDKVLQNLSHAFITSREDLDKLVEEQPLDRVLGLFAPAQLGYSGEQAEVDDPSLEEITRAAIKMLSNKERGYLVFIEEGRIDHGHHANEAGRALQQTLELDKAVTAALAMVDLEETLIVVTADHSHGLTVNGYPDRGSNILGSVEEGGMSFPTLMYSTGPGGLHTPKSYSSTRYPSTVRKDLAHHTGEEVAVYAIGPQSHLFRGLKQQTYIPNVIAYAACIGDGRTFCKEEE